MEIPVSAAIKQHLIDPETCMRCNTCESVCPSGAITHDAIDVNLAFSRTPGQPKRHVHDLMRARADDVAALLADADSYFYVCGLRSMEDGVVAALRDIAEEAGQRWEALAATLKREGRLHFETF
jgi:benzoyl-CoA 2,3-dioxygenase component A